MTLSQSQFERIYKEAKDQPPWRTEADRQADYADGNQLSSDILQRMQAIGMPPAIEPLIGSALEYVCGSEAKNRRDWRVLPSNGDENDDLAQALGEKLKQAEKHAKVDRACSKAFKSQAGLGIGWVEVSRNPDPFKYPYRTKFVHRNEIWFDWKGSDDPEMDDHRWLLRRRWVEREQATQMFPQHKKLIEAAYMGVWSGFDFEGGDSTDLTFKANPGEYARMGAAWFTQRGSTIEEQEWRDTEKERVALSELWYREYVKAKVLRTPGGRVVEFDDADPAHVAAVELRAVEVLEATVGKMRVSYWLGPHKLSDEPTPYAHNQFPYVPFWYNREDRTGVPFGLVRGWMYLQDTVNATLSKLRWGLSSVMTIRTAGAVAVSDEVLREAVARPDADIILDPRAMKDGGIFERKRDFQLTDQQHQMLADARAGIERVGNIGAAFKGSDTNIASNALQQSLTQQSGLGLGRLFANAEESRTQVGELLLSMILQDMQGKQEAVQLKGDTMSPSRVVNLNMPNDDGHMTNDVSRARLRVEMTDVPSTPTYRAQQLMSFSEAFKSTPSEFQRVLFPIMFNLMDVPNRDQAVEAIRRASEMPTEEDIQKRIEQALAESDVNYKMKELEVKALLDKAKINKLEAETVAVGTTATYQAMQAAGVAIAAPHAVPVADAILEGAGYTVPDVAAVNPNLAGVNPVPPSGNTSPASPPSPKQGIETQTLGDS
jgi:hypothetical protein